MSESPNKTKPTPGPWSCDLKRKGDRALPFTINCPDGDPLARVIVSGDARLIAAAPELLEALRPLQVWAEHARREARAKGWEGEAAFMGELADNAKAAIAKATQA